MGGTSKRKLFVQFHGVNCQCGELRPAGQPCGSCGRKAEPTEVDPDLQRRKSLVGYVRAAISTEPAPNSAVASRDRLEPLLGTGGDALGDLILLANAALSSPGVTGFEPFRSTVRIVTEFANEARRITSLRPLRALRPPLLEVASSMELAANALLDALDSGTIEAVQRNNGLIQPAIDATTEAIGRASAIIAAWTILDPDVPPLEAMMRLAADQAGSTDLLNLADYGLNQIAIHMRGAVVPVENGLLGAVAAAQAQILFDEETFWNVARSVSDRVAEHIDRLVALAGSSAWSQDWSRSVERSLWAAERFAHLAGRASHDDEAVRTVLALCHDVQETLTKSLLATLRYVANPNVAYEDLLANGVANLAEWATANGLPEFDVFAVPSRHAFAHNDWRIDENEVVLCEVKPPKRGVARLNADELNDHALAIQELTMAALVGIVVAAATCSVDLPTDDDLASKSAGPIALAILATCGWVDLSVERPSDSVVSISGRCTQGSVSHFAAIGYLFPADSRLDIKSRSETGERGASLDLDSLRTWSGETTEPTKLLAFAQFLHTSTIDGLPIASTAELRRAVAAVTSPWLTEETNHLGVVAVFRKARQVATACDDEELLRVLKTAQGWRISRLQGTRRSVSEIEEYLSWGQQKSDIDLTI